MPIHTSASSVVTLRKPTAFPTHAKSTKSASVVIALSEDCYFGICLLCYLPTFIAPKKTASKERSVKVAIYSSAKVTAEQGTQNSSTKDSASSTGVCNATSFGMSKFDLTVFCSTGPSFLSLAILLTRSLRPSPFLKQISLSLALLSLSYSLTPHLSFS